MTAHVEASSLHAEDGSVVRAQGARKQRVQVRGHGGMVIFESTVLEPEMVTRNERAWRDLARMVWRRNALEGMVGFGFDVEDRLVGRVENPLDSLDDEELLLRVERVAVECDRFGVGVLGEDWA